MTATDKVNYPLKSKLQKPKKDLLYEVDEFFQTTYITGQKISGTLTDNIKRKERFYNLAQFLGNVENLRGEVAECGCWKGLSSYLICQYLRRSNSKFTGSSFHIFDSFMGLSEPTNADALSKKTIDTLKKDFGTVKGAFNSSVGEVKHTLHSFPNVQINEGWIPDVFLNQTSRRYKFVHIDVDLYEPTICSLKYFYPKLVTGGLIICDDYGSLHWQGARRAVDEFRRHYNLRLIVLSTGQAIIIKENITTRCSLTIKSVLSRFIHNNRGSK